MRRNKSLDVCIVIFCLWAAIVDVSVAGRIVYVDDDASGADNGSSWADAFNYLQDALHFVGSSGEWGEIRVGQGVYTPDSNSAAPNGTGDRKATFILKADFTIMGGYAGAGQPDPNERDIEIYRSILSGDLYDNDRDVNNSTDLPTEPTRSENSHHIVTCSDSNAMSVLDGFTISGGNATGPSPHYCGGGIFNNGGNATIANCIISNNNSANGGGMYNAENASSILLNCKFVRNSAETESHTRGGGLANYGSITLSNCSFTENAVLGKHSAKGGGMYNGGNNTVLQDCVFTGNTGQMGAGMFSYDAVLTRCTFNVNAGEYGAGMASRATLALTDCNFVGNLARYGGGICNGGGIYYPSYGSSTLQNCRFHDNSASFRGGAVYSDDGTIEMLNCVLTENSGSYGGGIYHTDDANTRLRNCSLEKNFADHYGGAAYGEPFGSFLCTDCTFVHNTAANHGGAGAGKISLTDCVLSRNRAEAGGALWGSWGARYRCKFDNNQARLGGAVYGGSIFSNCIFEGNRALEYGGAVYAQWDEYLRLANCTFVGNLAEFGDAVAAERAQTIDIMNCILQDGAIEVANQDVPITIGFCNILGGQNAVSDPNGYVVWGDGNIDEEPEFVDPGHWDANGTPEDANDDFWAGGDCHLKSQGGRWDTDSGAWVIDAITSPCIDAGDPMMPIGLEPFPNGATANMGAYGGTDQASKSYFHKPPCETRVAGDTNGDCIVDWRDFAFLSNHWLEDNNSPRR